ncbi:helix-turn-helix domain-containing protein [Kribbella sp. NPDC050124]|uniref:helix-turn-helix domain-containing protein n=1 Tax=Kribbella sp. NPDC050124 TaxID=3364114 RepID=UPI0037A2A4A0
MTVTRIREIRTLRGMTVRQLADHSGGSSALISQVKRGVTDPSLETMRRIAGALDTPMFSLFQDGDDGRTVARFVLSVTPPSY